MDGLEAEVVLVQERCKFSVNGGEGGVVRLGAHRYPFSYLSQGAARSSKQGQDPD